MPGQKIIEADRKKIDPKFICTVCTLLLHEPMQTPCGHLLCNVCLQALFSSPNPKCPSDGTQLRKEDCSLLEPYWYYSLCDRGCCGVEAFPDAFTRRELLALHLHCANEGCDWSGTYKDLQEHSNNCDHALIECEHDPCKKEMKRILMAQHLATECLHRQVSCKYCNQNIPFNLLEKHVNVECPEALLTCEHCEKPGLRRRQLAQHKMSECDEVPAECEFKNVGCEHAQKMKRKDMRKHLRDGLSIHVQLLLKIILDLMAKLLNLLPKVEIIATLQAGQEGLKQRALYFTTEIKSLAEKFTAMVRTLTALQKRVENIEKRPGAGGNDSSTTEIRRLEIELREKDALILQLQERLNRIDASLAANTARLSDIGDPNEGQAMTSCNGTLLWKIDDFSQKRRDAVSGTQTAIYSHHFYTSQFGYKMCARIYLNGDGFGKETHISLFFVVMKGEHDALLPWPFQKKITMMMLDQSNGDHMIDAFRSDPESSSFQKPNNRLNVASGSPLFMPLDGLNNRAYVKDDILFIKIIVD